jgi:hypothetical protein
MSNRRSRLRGLNPVQVQNPILGAVLVVDGVVIGEGFQDGAKQSAPLIEAVQGMADQYRTSGLPPKVMHFQYENSQVLALFSRRSLLLVWISSDANLGEIEIAARKVVTTAHLEGSLNPSNPIVAVLSITKPVQVETASTSLAVVAFNPPTMNWSEAARSLENIITKVLSQAQATKMIQAAMQRKGIDFARTADGATLKEIGNEITLKIPSRPIRQTLEREVAELAKTLN